MGNTIRNDMNTERFFELIQISARITNEATGVALIAYISGASKIRTALAACESAASKIPSMVPRANPKRIRPKEPSTAR